MGALQFIFYLFLWVLIWVIYDYIRKFKDKNYYKKYGEEIPPENEYLGDELIKLFKNMKKKKNKE